MFLAGSICALAPLVRLVSYVAHYANPLSLRARLATGQWLAPGYDVVYLTPLFAWCAGVICIGILFQQPEWAVIYLAPLVASLVLFLCLALGPDMRTWQLTGKHTIRKVRLDGNDVKVG